MLKIEIEISRPGVTMFWILAIAGAIVWSLWGEVPVQADVQGAAPARVFYPMKKGEEKADVPDGMGGDVWDQSETEREILRLRTQQEVLKHREEILEYQLTLLEKSDPEGKLLDVRREFVQLFQDRVTAEQKLLASFQELWEAQGRAITFGRGFAPGVQGAFRWPVDPIYGVSAGFLDAAYEKRFGLPHLAIDIPIEQGSIVRAAHQGIVVDVTDNGMGFNSVTLQSPSGIATLYGHVSAFSVQEGQEVHAGDPIALSGGSPGTPGAGWLSTGPHLHFEVIEQGKHVDPTAFLPSFIDR